MLTAARLRRVYSMVASSSVDIAATGAGAGAGGIPLGPVSRVYGPETKNFYSGNPLNRISFARDDYEFLDRALKHKGTRFLTLRDLDVSTRKLRPEQIVSAGSGHQIKSELAYLGYEDVKNIVGDPFSKPEKDQIKAWSSKRDAIGIGRVATVFLGIDESAPEATHVNYKHFRGQAYFAVDVTPERVTDSGLKSSVEQLLESKYTSSVSTTGAERSEEIDYEKAEHRNLRFGPRLSTESYALYAQARMYIDWNNRNKFCGGCGSRNMSVNGGTKLVCPSHDDGVELPFCETRGVVTNLSFPRTDTSIIVAVVNRSNDRILLGCGRRFPKGFYSCLAGFLEPAESIEDCVRREVYEESGVTVGRVHVHSTQPWPYPANIMVGCIAEVADDTPEASKIHLGHDPELLDAQWFTFDEVRKAVHRSKQPGYRFGATNDYPLNVPGPEAIANILIDAVVSTSSSLSKI
ncbi:NAD(+) diphosphatase [Sugiyamaella lignohabitans]|uniref:NAD(+) diphosphatase n=1 Tax=Sugiyamaella lignohabitans TaxID=796027 RepID=A0A167CLA2_9ASCO|nr:NAD(+) diphosphatase [Sugiyamaella lignohabitans]ANB11844.1 NAD(+) diphosphatase [Sugiyamaella lignohabitans]